jgi:hypothetical protein
LANAAVTNPKLANESVSTQKIAADAVTGAQLNESTVGQVPFRRTREHRDLRRVRQSGRVRLGQPRRRRRHRPLQGTDLGLRRKRSGDLLCLGPRLRPERRPGHPPLQRLGQPHRLRDDRGHRFLCGTGGRGADAQRGPAKAPFYVVLYR